MWNYRPPAGRLDADGIKLWSEDTFRGISEAFQKIGRRNPYIPLWTSNGTQPALGNGTLTGAYAEIGQWMVVSFRLDIGSTSTFGTGVYYISLPRVPVGVAPNWLGSGLALDSSGGVTYPLTVYNGLGLGKVEFYASSIITPTVPFTWATGDALWGTIGYPLE